jgi:hypothetical protein
MMTKKHTFILILFLFAIFSIPAQTSRISYFNPIILGNDIRLDFTISKGITCNEYQVLKSYDSTNFNILYDYSGVCGNTNSDQSFSYTDAGVQKNTYLYYKILIPPFDYSKMVRMFVDQKNTKKNLLYTYPQPVVDLVTIYLENENYDDYTLRIMDCNGTMRRELKLNAYKYITTNVSDLEHGLYCILLIDSGGNFSRGKIIKN